MKKNIGLFGILALLWNCQKIEEKKINDNKSNKIEINQSDFKVDEIPEGCYFSINQKDTTFVTIDDNLGTITGKIEFPNDSIGELMGFAAEDTLKLEVQYKINEDSVINQDLWFLKQYGNLYEADAKRYPDGRYKHQDLVQFEEGIIYKPIDCKDK